MIILNAKIITMEGSVYENGFLSAENGVITAIGPMEEAPPAGQEVIDAKGAMLLPGFVDAHCHIGMWEDGLGFEGDDGNEDTDPVTPHLRALDAVNPMDKCFQEACEAGVTSVITGPGSANAISGCLMAMKTTGRQIDKMVLKEPVAMKMALGENPKSTYHGKNQAPVTRMATAALIREQLFKARKYWEQLRRAAADDELDEPEYDFKCEALIPVLKKEIPVHIHAHRADDIFTAIRLCREFDLDYVLIHCTEGHLIAEELKEANPRIVIGPILCDRSKPELKNHTPANGGVLYRAGLDFAICTDHPVIPAQYLPLSAGVCVRDGLPYEKALESITIIPARICGIDDRVGSLAVGKDADFSVFSADPLSVYSRPDMVFVSGKRVK